MTKNTLKVGQSLRIVFSLAAMCTASATLTACQTEAFIAAIQPDSTPTRAEATGENADGTLPDGANVFDEALPGISHLDPQLKAALQDATQDAAEEGIEIIVNSGWRSPTLQQEMLEEAIDEYGSELEASRWVATPETSAHVRGIAVDLGLYDVPMWLTEEGRGEQYGLCQVYDNEPWHFEYVADAAEYGCPDLYFNPTYDPRMAVTG